MEKQSDNDKPIKPYQNFSKEDLINFYKERRYSPDELNMITYMYEDLCSKGLDKPIDFWANVEPIAETFAEIFKHAHILRPKRNRNNESNK